MRYEEAGIGTVVCLQCGAKVDISELVIEDIQNLDVPEDVKTKGGFFQAIVCPECKKSVYLGFIATKLKPGQKPVVKPTVAAEADVYERRAPNVDEDAIDIDEAETDALMMELFGTTEEPKIEKPAKTSKKKAKPNRHKPATAKCSSCGKEFETGDVTYGDFGTKCNDCIKKGIRR